VTDPTTEELLQRAVRLRGIRLGRVADVLFDADAARVVGFDVLCGDAAYRFLPFSAVTLGAADVEIGSTLVLLEAAERDFYRLHGRSLVAGGAELRALRVLRDGTAVTAAPAGRPSGRW
jgi:hypothetical protein